jgi:hypothetical protein
MSTPPVLEWITQQPSFNTVADDQDSSIISDSAGNSYIVYRTKGATSGNTKTSTTGFDIVILKLNTAGVVQWVKQYADLSNTDGSPIGSFPSITINPAGSHIYIAYGITGIVSGGTSAGGADTVVVKLATTDGSIDWIKQIVATNTDIDDISPSITCYTDGGADFIYVGYYNTEYSSAKITVYKLGSVGNFVWKSETPTVTSGSNDCRIIADLAGNVYGSYDTDATVPGPDNNGPGIVVFKMDPSGTIPWIIQNSFINPAGSGYVKSNIIFNPSNNRLYISYVYQQYAIIIYVASVDASTGVVIQEATQIPSEFTPATFQTGLGVDVSGNIYISYFSTNDSSTKLTIVKRASDILTELWNISPSDISPVVPGNATGFSSLSVNSSGSIYVTYATNGVVPGGTDTGGIDIVVAKLGEPEPEPVLNSFAAKVNPYLALGPVLVYTKATVDALVAGTTLPTQTTVSWAPMGVLLAGSLLRDLRRSVTVPVSASNPLAAYRFQRVQLIGGSGSEGVGGSLADQDAYQTGWICTWAASGVAPVF